MSNKYEIQPDFLNKLKIYLDQGQPHEDINIINEIANLSEQKEIQKGMKGVKRERERNFVQPSLRQEFGAMKSESDTIPKAMNEIIKIDLEIQSKLLDLEELILDEVEPEVLADEEYIKLVQSIKDKYNF